MRIARSTVPGRGASCAGSKRSTGTRVSSCSDASRARRPRRSPTVARRVSSRASSSTRDCGTAGVRGSGGAPRRPDSFARRAAICGSSSPVERSSASRRSEVLRIWSSSFRIGANRVSSPSRRAASSRSRRSSSTRADSSAIAGAASPCVRRTSSRRRRATASSRASRSDSDVSTGPAGSTSPRSTRSVSTVIRTASASASVRWVASVRSNSASFRATACSSRPAPGAAPCGAAPCRRDRRSASSRARWSSAASTTSRTRRDSSRERSEAADSNARPTAFTLSTARLERVSTATISTTGECSSRRTFTAARRRKISAPTSFASGVSEASARTATSRTRSLRIRSVCRRRDGSGMGPSTIRERAVTGTKRRPRSTVAASATDPWSQRRLTARTMLRITLPPRSRRDRDRCLLL